MKSICSGNPAARAETISERTDRTMAKVVSVNISEKKGTLKKPVPEIKLKLRHGQVFEVDAFRIDVLSEYAGVVKEGVVRPGDEIEVLK